MGMRLGTGLGTGPHAPESWSLQPRPCSWHRSAWAPGVHAGQGLQWQSLPEEGSREPQGHPARPLTLVWLAARTPKP